MTNPLSQAYPPAELKQLLEHPSLCRTLDAAADAIELTDASFRYTWVNQSFENITGYTKDEVLGKSPRDILKSNGETETFWHTFWEQLQSGETWRGSFFVLRKSGEERRHELTISPIKNEGVITGYIAIRRDITDFQERRAQGVEADRMALLGMLAAGIAHDMNNPLTWVLTNLEYIRDKLPPNTVPNEVQLAINEAHAGATRVNRIVQDLQGMSRFSNESPRAVNLQDILESALHIAQSQFNEQTHILRAYEEIPLTRGNRSQLGRVFLNLIVNAAQAVQSSEQNQPGLLTLRTYRASSTVTCVAFSDNGPGICPSRHQTIFEPFYTTKPDGIGTGLGLYICRRILETLGGTIAVESDGKTGTTFKVFLPIAPGQGIHQSAPRAPQRRPRMASMKILLIDDEPLIGRSVQRALHEHQITVVHSSQQAMRHLETHSHIDLIMCDVMMPGRSGIELYQDIVDRWPTLAPKIVFMTGGVVSLEEQGFLEGFANPHILKPFDARSLRDFFHSWKPT